MDIEQRSPWEMVRPRRGERRGLAEPAAVSLQAQAALAAAAFGMVGAAVCLGKRARFVQC